MADVKISGLPASTTPLAGTEVLPIVQGGQTRQVSIANVTAGRAITASTIQATTTVGVGAATPAASGAGITFPATQSASTDANTLDDYEEGTWTPTLTPATSGTITVQNPNLCGYTKIGRVVTVNGIISIISVNLPVGDTVTIGGLPFTSNSASFQRSAGVARCFALTTGALNANMIILSSVTTAILYVDASLFQTNSQFYFQLTYTV